MFRRSHLRRDTGWVEVNRLTNNFLRYGYPAAIAVVVVLVWEYATGYFEMPRYLMPAPSLILNSFEADWRLIWINLWPHLQEMLIGYLINIVIELETAPY